MWRINHKPNKQKPEATICTFSSPKKSSMLSSLTRIYRTARVYTLCPVLINLSWPALPSCCFMTISHRLRAQAAYCSPKPAAQLSPSPRATCSFNPSAWEAEQAGSFEFKVVLIYSVSSRTDRPTLKSPDLKNKTKHRQIKQTKNWTSSPFNPFRVPELVHSKIHLVLRHSCSPHSGPPTI